MLKHTTHSKNEFFAVSYGFIIHITDEHIQDAGAKTALSSYTAGGSPNTIPEIIFKIYSEGNTGERLYQSLSFRSHCPIGLTHKIIQLFFSKENNQPLINPTSHQI